MTIDAAPEESNDRWFRVTCVLPFAALRAQPGQDPPILDAAPCNLHSERARAALARVSRRDHDIREALFAIYGGLVHLEREVSELRRNLRLAAAGIDLQPELVQIGGDGLTLQRSKPWRSGDLLHLYIAIAVRDSERVLGVPAEVTRVADGTTELMFGAMTPEQRDRIVAFTFQQQGRERRRVLDADTSVD